MTDRGSCKVFSPNIFNPTKCQNCYKPKEGHPSGPSPAAPTGKMQRGMSLPVTRDRNTTTVKTVLKEGFLSIGKINAEGNTVQDWEKRWYVLYSSGELEGFPIEDGEVMRSKSFGVTVLQDFIRMLDGTIEIGEENSLGLKSLKDILYLKANNKVDFENWWKELSTFVPSPMKRAYSAGAANKPQLTNKTWVNKTHSSPLSSGSSKVSKPPNLQSPVTDTDNTQVDGLNSKITRLQSEVKKIPKLEEERRKLELEVNYWKEYVTNSNTMKRSGGKMDTEKELNDARIQIISLQDQLNEAEKQIGTSTNKIAAQNKELSESRANLEEANNMINMHKASINDLKMELSQRKERKSESKDIPDGLPVIPDLKALNLISEERSPGALSPTIDASSERGETSDIELKFMTLREKMKRIEKELFVKSKELEKANEGRSKVAKYTRTLLQELEAKLNDTQQRLAETTEKLSNTTIELEMERGRRKRLESERENPSLSRTSSISSTLSFQEQNSIDAPSELSSLQSDKIETEVNNRYVDYYRSRFREAEAALLEKDKKLNEVETKNKEMELRYKNVFKQCRTLDDIQIKLSDATHKLSDRQLKIHELTREVEKLRGYERGYDRKTKELQISSEKLKETEQQLSDMKRKVSLQERDLEGFRIREVVMKERLTAFEEESSDDEEEDDDDDDDDADADNVDSRLERSIEAKERVEKMVDLEGQVRLLSSENESLKSQVLALEDKVKQTEKIDGEAVVETEEQNAQEGSDESQAEVKVLQTRVQVLEAKLIAEEDKLYSSISELKEKHKNEVESMIVNSRHDSQQLSKLKEECAMLKKERDEWMQSESKGAQETNEIVERVKKLEGELDDYSKRLNEQGNEVSNKIERINELENLVEEKKRELAERTDVIAILTEKITEKDSIVKEKLEIVEQVQKLFTEKDTLFKNLQKDNVKLREELAEAQRELFFLNDEQKKEEAAVSPVKVAPVETVPVDSAPLETEPIEIVPVKATPLEVASLPTESQQEDTDLREELRNARELLVRSQVTRDGYKNELENIGKKYLDGEQKIIELSQKLESTLGIDRDWEEGINSVQVRIEAMQKQLSEANTTMQAKAVELEKERLNIIHLVDVTSAYIKELEGSLSESREKVEELQNVIEESRSNNGKRMPPEGSSGKEREDSLSDHSDIDVKEKEEDADGGQLKATNVALTAKIASLESDIVEIQSRYEEDKRLILELHENEVQELRGKLKRQDLDDEDGRDSDDVKKNADEQLFRPETDGSPRRKSEKYGSESSDMDMLERVQELEIELEQVRNKFNEEMKLKEEQHSKLIKEMKEDMGRVIAASVSSNMQSGGSEHSKEFADLEDQIKKLEKEKEELKMQYEEELEAEKEAHQYEMEETIRDMLTVTQVFKSGKYNEKEEAEEGDGSTSQKSSRRSSLVSQEGMEEIRKEYDKKLIQKENEYKSELDNMKQDMMIVIEAMQHGGASTAILELTNKNQALRKELDQTIADFEIERGDLNLKVERLESNNFFGLRRNEEMGTKIFQMQIELEEMERKHRLEMEVYKDKDNPNAIHGVVKVNEDLEKKVKALEAELLTSRENSLKEMELLAIKVHEEKRKAISEMTDTVLNLEAIIDEMKEKHEEDIREFEERSREEKLDALDQVQNRVSELEALLLETKEENEEKMTLLEEDYEKRLEELRDELETKAEYYRVLSEENKVVAHTVDVTGAGSRALQDTDSLQARVKELEEKVQNAEKEWESQAAELKAQFVKETEKKQSDFDNQISEIRSEYEEKLKSCIKESARRQSVSSRKTESQKIKELTSRVEDLELILDEQQKEHQVEIADHKSVIEKLQDLVGELRASKQPGDPGPMIAEETDPQEPTSALDIDKEAQTRIDSLESQIKRYEKRINYYKTKAQKDEESENSRVNELQQEVHGLREEMKELTDRDEAEVFKSATPGMEQKPTYRRYSEETSERGSPPRRDRNKRWSDLHLTDMVFTNEGVEHRKGGRRDRESWKRWSDLQLRQDAIVTKIGELDEKRNPKLLTQVKKDEVAKSGSVARRKKLWENFVGEEPRKIQRPLSSVRP